MCAVLEHYYLVANSGRTRSAMCTFKVRKKKHLDIELLILFVERLEQELIFYHESLYKYIFINVSKIKVIDEIAVDQIESKSYKMRVRSTNLQYVLSLSMGEELGKAPSGGT